MRLINADATKQTYTADLFDTKEDFERVNDIFDYASIVDAMPVVYCKNCKYADTERRNETEKRYCDSILFCRNSDLCNDELLAMWPDDFCSYSERKEREDNEIDKC